MTKRKARRQPRLSVSEARAEAAVIVLRQVLAGMPAKTRNSVALLATIEAVDAGVYVIVDEVREICEPPPEV